MKKLLLFVALSLLYNFNAFANDSNRLSILEKEIKEIKQIVSKLESSISNSVESKNTISSDGWKFQKNWRSLSINMSPIEVRNLLGEPQQIDGGTVAYWFYQNGGIVCFMNDKLYHWTEPIW